MSDYIPPKDTELLVWTQNLASFCENNAARLKLDGGQTAGYRAKTDLFAQTMAKIQSPDHSSIDITAKNTAKEALISASRDLVQGSLTHNPAVSDEDRVAAGITVPDKTRTHAPQPKSRPEAKITAALRQITISISDEGSHNRGKPDKVHGCEARFDFLDGTPGDIEDLRHSIFITVTSHVFDFEEKDRGKRLYFALRWENTRGEKGPWSQLYDMFVP
jgi:hypothetical protein